MFCRHQWAEVKRRSVTGMIEMAHGGHVDNIANPYAQAAMFGYTLIEERCEKCGKVTISQHIGAMDEPGDP